MITLVAISNPFMPATARTIHEVPWREGIMLGDVLRAAGVPTLRHACVIDGLAVPEEMLEGFPVADGTTVIAMPSVAGGGFTKMFAEVAVMIAATVVTGGLATGPLAALDAGGLGSFFAGIGLGNLSAGVATLIGAGVALGGNMLINAFMGSSGGGNTGNSFNPTGPKTIASGGTPIPKGYGTFKSGGNIIASYVDPEGADNYMNVLVSYGWGPINAIKNIAINNNSIQNYSAVTYFTRLGTNDQTPIPGFNNIVNGYPQEIRAVALAGTPPPGEALGNGTIDPGTPVIITGTGTDTQGLQVVMQFPNGLFYSNDDGSLRSLTVTYQIQYAISGTDEWQNPVMPNQTRDIVTYTDDGTVATYPTWVVVPTDQGYSSGVVYAYDNGSHTPGDPWTGTSSVEFINQDGSSSSGPLTLTGEWQLCDPNLNQQYVINWFAGWCLVTNCSQGSLYYTTSIFNLPPNKYDVKVTKYGCAFAGDPIEPREANNNRTGDQSWVYAINEVQYQDLSYPNIGLLGVRALATNQLSGSNINVTADITYGITATLPAALAGFGLDNPAVVTYDMLVADFYGGAVNPSCIDVPAWAAWAAYNDELVSDGAGGTIKRHVFNGVFDVSGTNLWKCLQKVAMMAQASIVQIGQNYTVVVDQAVSVPAQVFTSANILKDSIKDTWLSFDDRANRIEVTFADAFRNYRTDEPCAVMLPADIQAGVEVKTTRVELLGCTNRAQAWHWAYRKLMSTDLLLLSRSFDVGIEAVACQVGSVIGVQDDVTQYAYGGRIQAGSSTTVLMVDVPDLPFVSGEGWTATVVHPVVVRGTGTILSVVGNLLTFTAPIPTANISSVENASGKLGVVQAFGTSTLTVASSAGFTAGQAVTFYDQDVMDTQPVQGVVGTELIMLSPFLQAPSPDAPWVYGQSAGSFPAKLFTVTNIRKKGDFTISIDCLEYNPAVYSDDTPIITSTLGVPDISAAVTNLIATENYTTANGSSGGQDSTINIGWIPGSGTKQVQIWVARNEAGQPLSAEVLVTTVNQGSTCSLIYPTGSILQIRAVGVGSNLGNNASTAPFSTAPVVTITVQGSGLAPGDVPNFVGNLTPTTAVLQWSAAANATNYEVRYNSDISNTSWQAADLVYAGTALSFTDSIPRQGMYLIKALTATSVESINAASWNYLLGPSRINLVPLAAGQTPVVTVASNTVSGSTATVVITAPAQVLFRQDGTPLYTTASSLTLSGLALSTVYYIYPYLDQTFYVIHSAKGDTAIPDTATNPTTAAAAAAGSNYPAPLLTVTTPGSGGTGGSGASPTFTVNGTSLTVPVTMTFGGRTVTTSQPVFRVTSITVDSGGSGVTATTATLSGYSLEAGEFNEHSETLTLTLSGGAVTGVSGFDHTTDWTGVPTVMM